MRKDFDEKALFDLFTYKGGKCYRDYLTKPFMIGEYVYASDARHIIRINAGLLKGEYPGDNIPKNVRESIDKFLSFPINCSKDVTAGQLERALASIPQIDEEVMDVTECSECNGSGEVEWYYNAFNGTEYSDYDECPVCDGSGAVIMSHKTGRKIPDYDKTIGFFGLFNVKGDNVRALLGTMNLLGIDKALLFVATEKVSVFVIDKGITVYIANIIGKPCYIIE